MYDNRVDLSQFVISAWGQWTAMSAGPTKNCLKWVIDGLATITGFETFYLDRDNSFDPAYIIPYFLKHHTIPGGSEYELTAEKIINVWLTSTLDNQQWTIGMIDYMRKEIWDKPFNFPLIAGQIGGG